MQSDHFVRLPSQWLDALLRVSLNGTEWRILLWVIRETCGWNRSSTRFSWYQVARELGMDRGGTYRVGKRLLENRFLRIEDGRITFEENFGSWQRDRHRAPDADIRPRSMTNLSADKNQRKGGQLSSLFRRAIDSSKDVNKSSKNINNVFPDRPDDNSQRLESRRLHHPAGAAHPIPAKYDSQSGT